MKKMLLYFLICLAYTKTLSPHYNNRTLFIPGGPSLFSSPMLLAVEEILAESSSAEAVAAAFLHLNPDIDNPNAYNSKKISLEQQFCLHKIIETLLDRCQNIMQNPKSNLLKRSANGRQELQPFSAFEPNSIQQSFLKYFRFISRMQMCEIRRPASYSNHSYFNTPKFNEFFESNIYSETDCIEDRLHLWIYPIIINCACIADRIEEEISKD